jgi:uncharacterized coiled-coil protein SlyX
LQFKLDKPAVALEDFTVMKTTVHCFVSSVAILYLAAVAQKAQAVVPPPDGGYPGFTTAEGEKALFSLTTGSANTAVGWYSLFSNAAGGFNTATGAGSLLFNTANDNTAFGAAALLFNTTGTDNTAVGAAALSNNTLGQDNTGTGAFALLLNTTGNFNTANGFDALFSNTEGQFNTADGNGALDLNTAGNGNTAIGASTLQGNIDGDDNTALGSFALSNNTTGARNVALGVNAGQNVTTADNVICIGSNNVNGANVSDTCFIGNIRGVTTQNANAIPVLIDTAGQLGTMSSSRRFKKEIKPMESASEAILGLKPVTFEYRGDKTDTPQFGLIAEEVAEVNPDLVVRDGKGEIYSVRYDAVNAMLLNEFLKEHRKVEEQQATITKLTSTVAKQETGIAQQRKNFEATLAEVKKGMEIIVARFKEQDAKIQRVSEQIEKSRPAPQIASNHQ